MNWISPRPRPRVCPTCGRCPSCGHSPYVTTPYIPYYPPTYPYPVWINTGISTTSTGFSTTC